MKGSLAIAEPGATCLVSMLPSLEFSNQCICLKVLYIFENLPNEQVHVGCPCLLCQEWALVLIKQNKELGKSVADQGCL